MARLGWDAISSGYRSRLERGGITRESYEQGATLSGARGHAATPERPEQAARDNERYRDYLGRRDNAVRLVQRAKESMFSGSERWSASKSLKYINKNLDGTNRTAEQIKRAAAIAAKAANGDMTLDEIRDEYPDIWEMFFYG